jgi:hypothetical protein
MIRMRTLSVFLSFFLLILLPLIPSITYAHGPRYQEVGNYRITFWTEPPDPLTSTPTTLRFKVVDKNTGMPEPVHHVFVVVTDPNGNKEIGLTFEDSLVWRFRSPGGNEVGMSIFLINGRILEAAFPQDVYGSAEGANPLSAAIDSVALNIRYIAAKLLHLIGVILYTGTLFTNLLTGLLKPTKYYNLSEAVKHYKRYRNVLALSMGLVTSTGVYGLYIHGFVQTNIENVIYLFASTPYGAVMLIKLFVVSSILILGTYASILIRRLDKVVAVNEVSQIDPDKASEKQGNLREPNTNRLNIISLANAVLAIIAAFLGVVFVVLHLPIQK